MLNDFEFLFLTAAERAAMTVDVYLLAGQSNCDGTTTFDSAAPGERDGNRYENVRYVGVRRFTDGRYRYRYERYEPVHEGLGYTAERIGPELGMARVLDPLYDDPTHKAVIVKVAAGGTSLLRHEPLDPADFPKSSMERFYDRGSWYPETLDRSKGGDDRPTGYLTRLFKSYTTQIWNELISMGFAAVNLRALCWMQGEEDRRLPEEYAEVFPVWCREVREHLTKLTGREQGSLPIVMGEISETFTDSTEEIMALNRRFIAAQNELAKTVPAVTVIPTHGFRLTELNAAGDTVFLGTDQWHWAYGDMVKIGELFGKAAYAAK